MNIYKEIPQLISIEGWKDHPILFYDERVVRLEKYESTKLILSPQYYYQGIPFSKEEMFLRKNVKERLLQASVQLPEGFSLVIWDTWRPFEVQQSLFEKYVHHFESTLSFNTKEDLMAYTETYVSLPSKNSNAPSPHSTGGAVDVTISDSNGILLNMGSDFDEMTSLSATRYFEEKLKKEGFLSKEEHEILLNRRLLFHIMSQAGFTNYQEEWWHYDFGNQFWGVITGKKALYGEIKR
jgi:zinc D-Ala-D-Ala dipeptidase